MDFPLPPGSAITVETFNNKELLGPEAVSFILRTTLTREHHDDPNVLKFISEYVSCRDVRQASALAGIPSAIGHKLRRLTDIHVAINKLTEAAVMKYGLDANEVVEKVKEIAFVDIAEFENEDGTYKTSLRAISPETRRAVKKFKVRNLYERDPNGMQIKVGELIEVELWDKMKAVDLLGRETDLFKEKKIVEHGITENMRDILLASQERADQAVEEAREVTIEAEVIK